MIGEGRGMMAQEPAELDITVVITCYNEDDYIIDSINNVIEALRTTDKSFEIIVIDDKSSDNSVQKIQEYIAGNPGNSVKLVARKENKGLANNFVDGAFLGKGKYYRLCCGDNPESVETMANLYKYIGKVDVLIPFHRQDDIVGKSRWRKMLGKIFTFTMNSISGHDIGYYNGLAIYPRHLIMRWSPVSYGFGFQADAITRILDEEELRYAQVPMWGGVDRKGTKTTALTMRNLLSVFHAVLEILLRRVRNHLYGRKTRSKRVDLTDIS